MTEPDIDKLNDAIMDALGSAACNPDIFKTAMRAKHDLLGYVDRLRAELEALRAAPVPTASPVAGSRCPCCARPPVEPTPAPPETLKKLETQ